MRVLATKKSKKLDKQKKKNKNLLRRYFSLLYNDDYVDALIAKTLKETK